MGRRLRLHAGRRCCPPESLPSGAARAGPAPSARQALWAATRRRLTHGPRSGSDGLATKETTTLIPTSMVAVVDSVHDGLDASRAHPVGNITVLTRISPDLTVKPTGHISQ